MMDKEEQIRSVLLVSASEQFDAIIRRALGGELLPEVKRSATAARQSILECFYDLVVIGAPLPDEAGAELALDVTEKTGAGVLFVTPRESYDEIAQRLTPHGILVVPRPFGRGTMEKAIRFLSAWQLKLRLLERKLQAAEEKTEELKLVNRVKCLLIEKKRMTEDEAHRFIGKQAMDQGLSRRRAAMRILEELEE